MVFRSHRGLPRVVNLHPDNNRIQANEIFTSFRMLDMDGEEIDGLMFCIEGVPEMHTVC